MYRLLEILPAFLAWLTIFLMVFLSWKLPFFVAIFIILFDIYWLLKTIYFSAHLRYTFGQTRKNMKVNWLEKIRSLPGSQNMIWENIYHLIIFPMYREPYELVRESFASLAKSNYPKDKILVVLAIEERGGAETEETAQKIKEEFGGEFLNFLITKHPFGLPGEIPGKGSNETWAAKEAKRLLIDPLIEDKKIHSYDNVLVSVFDVDTQVFPEYFGRLVYVFLETENRLKVIYQPIPVFANNFYKAPLLARIISFSTTFWEMMQQARLDKLTTFSSQTIPLRALLDIGFWDTNVVSEDSHIFWQCYLRYQGEFKTVPLFYFVSMDANAAPTFWQTMKNIYKQQRRWAWGCENIAYLLTGFHKNKFIPAGKKWYWGFGIIEGFHSWATNSLMIFFLGWLPIILGGKNFNTTLLSYSLPNLTQYIMLFSTVGIITSAAMSVLLLPPRPSWFRIWHYVWYFFQWVFLPFTLIIFGAVPALDAQTRLAAGGKWRLGFWVTPKTRDEKLGL